ncbi:MAG: DNA replication/repair protein RecF [Acidimicrobiales bacterium]
MYVEKLSLVDFRNWSELNIGFQSDKLTFILGDNAQGKTNILEGIYFGARHKSFRSSERLPLIREGAEQSIIRIEVLSRDRRRMIASQINRYGRDRVLINGKQTVRFDGLLYDFPIVVFQPDDLSIIKDSPSYRRSYIDEAVESVDVQYGQLSSQYDRLLRQRNNLLRSIGNRPAPSEILTLDVWDEQLSDAAEKITLRRKEGLEELSDFILSSYRRISGDNKRIELQYAQSWSDSVLSSLRKTRENDLRKQSTGIGPHRDDIVINLDGFNSRNSVSQGEQRTLAVVLKLASATMIEKVTGETPVVLLDDIVSEFDSKRVTRLFESLPSGQIFVSGTFIPEGLSGSVVVEIERGTLHGAS